MVGKNFIHNKENKQKYICSNLGEIFYNKFATIWRLKQFPEDIYEVKDKLYSIISCLHYSNTGSIAIV